MPAVVVHPSFPKKYRHLVTGMHVALCLVGPVEGTSKTWVRKGVAMKLMRLASAATAVLTLTLLTGVVVPASQASVSFDFFYSDLSPHGSWMVSGEYGRVWQPRVYRTGWNPYHDGHWVYTDCGWAWVSDYTWGDVAYHYGTWVMDPRFGWVWVPGYTWA